MEIKYFEFNGKSLESFDSMICGFNGASGFVTTTSPSISYAVGKASLRDTFAVFSSTFDEGLSTTIQICKNLCNGGNKIYSIDEQRKISKWLSIRKYKKFKFLCPELSRFFYYGSFTGVNEVRLNNDVVGFELTLQTNAAYPYGEEEVFTHTFTSSTEGFTIANTSDELGNAFPTQFKVVCKSDGDLSITNSLMDNPIVVKACQQGEIITIDCSNKIVTTNSGNPIYERFNFIYPKLILTESSADNIFRCSLPCDFTIAYTPIRKVGILQWQ